MFYHENEMDRYVLLFCVCRLLGCNKNMPLSGKVTFTDDNSLVPCGMIHFDNGQQVDRGNIQPSTHYRKVNN